MLRQVVRCAVRASIPPMPAAHIGAVRQFAHAQAKTTDCWKCNHATDCCTFFCKHCDAIQPMTPERGCDYFELFQIPKTFALEQRTMEQTYWNLQKRLHPDLFGAKSHVEQELSAVNAALINDAYNVLKSPTTRVQYLLSLDGIDALGETASTAVDPALLMQTMEIREAIDDATDAATLDRLRQTIATQIDAALARLRDVYDHQHDVETTQQLAIELQYLTKCIDEIDVREEQLDV